MWRLRSEDPEEFCYRNEEFCYRNEGPTQGGNRAWDPNF